MTSTEQLFLSAEAQDMIPGDGEGQVGTEVFTIDVQSVSHTSSL
ncbi:MAG: hypothetical protein Q9P01_22365 [Anaerolineae bacterium]|nr:hypothetical protein [Anaerolineae bacterium]